MKTKIKYTLECREIFVIYICMYIYKERILEDMYNHWWLLRLYQLLKMLFLGQY